MPRPEHKMTFDGTIPGHGSTPAESSCTSRSPERLRRPAAICSLLSPWLYGGTQTSTSSSGGRPAPSQASTFNPCGNRSLNASTTSGGAATVSVEVATDGTLLGDLNRVGGVD